MAAPTALTLARAAPDLSILIVSYNTKAMTVACLDSVQAETGSTRYEIIAVDNNSSDGSADAIAAHALQPHIFARSDNLGFAGGNNLAACHAQGDYILLLNPDTVVLDGAIDRLMDFARARPDAMIWGGRTLFADKTLNPSSCWHRMTPWNLLCRATGLTGIFPKTTLFNGEAIGGFDRTTERDVDIVSGCFLLLRRSLWEKLGGFDPAFFMYGEEADLCLRAHALGARPRVTPAATIIHYGGASEATRTNKMIKLLAAKMTLIDRHWPSWQAPLGRCLMLAWPLSRWWATAAVAKLAGDSRWANAAATWGEIWRRRQEWGAGYTAKAPLSPAQSSTPH
jgi:GT2 family glycosyltransferase